MDGRSKLYFANLDSLRCLAAFAVVSFHIAGWLPWPATAGYWQLRTLMQFNGNGGRMAVSFFFVLSGFLITYLMLAEHRKYGSFSVSRFYLRRVLRIWPLYFLTLAIGFWGYPALRQAVTGIPYAEPASGPLFSLFLANFDYLWTNATPGSILGVHWSIAIEEQFYLLWPLLFVTGMRFRVLGAALVTVIVAANVFGIINRFSPQVLPYHTLTALNDLAVGALGAYMSFHREDLVRTLLARLSRPLLLAGYAAALLLLYYQNTLLAFLPCHVTFLRLIDSLIFLLIILEQNYAAHSPLKLGRFHLLTVGGKISYGLYLLHMVAISGVLLLGGGLHILAQAILCVILTIALSWLSYNVYEKPLLELKQRFSRV